MLAGSFFSIFLFRMGCLLRADRTVRTPSHLKTSTRDLSWTHPPCILPFLPPSLFKKTPLISGSTVLTAYSHTAPESADDQGGHYEGATSAMKMSSGRLQYSLFHYLWITKYVQNMLMEILHDFWVDFTWQWTTLVVFVCFSPSTTNLQNSLMLFIFRLTSYLTGSHWFPFISVQCEKLTSKTLTGLL